MRRWREGRHWQSDGKRLCAWIGLAADRWMVGVVWNRDSRCFAVGLGPLYGGVGALYDRSGSDA